MASIEKRTTQNGKTSYRVKIRLKGYPVQTATFERLTDAKKWVQHTEASIREGRHFKTAEAKKHTFNNLVARYCSEILPDYSEREQKERKSKLQWWSKGIGHYLLSDITPVVISEHKSQLDRSPATIDKYLKNLSHAFSTAVNEWGWLEEYSSDQEFFTALEAANRIKPLMTDWNQDSYISSFSGGYLWTDDPLYDVQADGRIRFWHFIVCSPSSGKWVSIEVVGGEVGLGVSDKPWGYLDKDWQPVPLEKIQLEYFITQNSQLKSNKWQLVDFSK